MFYQKCTRLRFGGLAFALVGFQVIPQTGHDLVLVSLFNLLLNFFQGKVHHVVMVQFFPRQIFAEPQP